MNNESDEPVYFDNLRVGHTRGRIIEENHYYAYGLKIAALSSQKLGNAAEGQLANEYLYNDKELLTDADLGWYDYGFRNYDPQIGRFPQLDPLTDDYPYLTPYQYASNDPITNIDIDGLEGKAITGAFSYSYDMASKSTNLWLTPANIVSKTTSTATTGAKVMSGGLLVAKSAVVGSLSTVTTLQVGSNQANYQSGNVATNFFNGAGDSYRDAVNSAKPMLKPKNWLKAGAYIVDMYSGSASGREKLQEVGQASVNTTNNMATWMLNAPNMSANQWAYSVGYAGGLYSQGWIGGEISNIFSKAETVASGGSRSTVLIKYYPANEGALSSWTNVMAKEGQIMDRFGPIYGSYASPVGTPFGMRALPQGTNPADYFKFKVLKPFPMKMSIVSPYFGQIGLGVQYKMPVGINYLEDFGYIEILK